VLSKLESADGDDREIVPAVHGTAPEAATADR
jgi:hypothetical protein